MNQNSKKSTFTFFSLLFKWPIALFKKFDTKLEEKLGFFVKHYGKSKFMIQMSKKAQIYGLEKLFLMGPKAFFYFFMFYLIRDVILYIIIPIYFMKVWE